MPKTASLFAPRTMEIRERAPLTANRCEAVIAVETAGICGTDLALFAGDIPVDLPLVPGHEFVGRVTSVGEWVDPAWVGRRVTGEINNTCIAYRRHILCAACRRDMPNHCQLRTVTGILQHDGAFAEEMIVPAGNLHALSENLDPILAALTEPMAAALQTFEILKIPQRETVVVLGPGRLGILIVFAAALRGHNVIAVSRSQAKRARALKFGAEKIFSPAEAEHCVKETTEGLGADIVVDATGSPEGFAQAAALVRPRGTLAIKTTCGLPALGIDMTQLVVDEVRVQGSRCGPFEPALQLLEKHQKTLKSLITSVRSLNDAQSAIESAYTEDKVLLMP